MAHFVLHILICSLASTSFFAQAEYRVFELKIENTINSKSRIVFSTLDQYQYPKYHPLEVGETIQYVDSWMCYENTAKKPYCKKPIPTEPSQSP